MDRAFLGKRIRQERLKNKLTQEQLAEMIDVSTTYIGFIERGERSVTLEKIIDISAILHVSVDTLLSPSPNNSLEESQTSELNNLWKAASTDERELILSLIRSVLNHKK